MLKTRLDSRSKSNDQFTIVNEEGEQLAVIKVADSSTTLEIATKDGLHIEKPNGWSSIK